MDYTPRSPPNTESLPRIECDTKQQACLLRQSRLMAVKVGAVLFLHAHIRWHTKVGIETRTSQIIQLPMSKSMWKSMAMVFLLIKTNASCHKSFYSLLNVNVKSISLLSSDLEATERYTAGCFLAGSPAHPLARCVRRRLVGDRWYTTNMFAPHHHHMWLSHQHHHRYKYYHHR